MEGYHRWTANGLIGSDPLSFCAMPLRFQTPILFALGLAFAAVFAAPVLASMSSHAIGVACGPAVQDLWNLWSSGGAPDSGGLAFPAAAAKPPLAAPSAWLVAQLLGTLGFDPITSWNLMFLLGYAGLIAGCISLGRRISPNSPFVARVALLIAVVGCTAWSPMLRHAGSGTIPMMLVPLVLSSLHAWVQPNAPIRHGIAASVLFAFACLGSWTATVLVLAMTPAFAVVIAQGIEGKQANRRAFAALLPGLVFGSAHIAFTHATVAPASVAAETLGPAWMTHAEGALLLPATAAVALPSIGILLLFLAGVASRPQSTVGWLLTATWGILLAAADTSRVLPVVYIKESFPILQPLNDWWLIAPLVSVPIGITAMRGVEALHRAQRDRLALAVLAIALIDQTLPSLGVSGLQRVRIAPPDAMMDALRTLPSGAILQLPASHEDCAQTDKLRLWQPMIGRSMSTASWDQPDGGQPFSYIARLGQTLANSPPKRASSEAALDPETFRCAMEDLFTLKDLGFSVVSVDRSSDVHPALIEGLSMVLGAPIFDERETVLWTINAPDNSGRGVPCSLPFTRSN